MWIGRSTALRGLLAASAAAGLTVAIAGGSPASAEDNAQAVAPAKTISMRSAGGFRFTGSTQVTRGQTLRIRNLADVREGGPHTFTLVASNVLPKSRKAMKDCFTPGKVCMFAGIAHEFDEQTETVGKPLVEAGQPGWDKRFSRTVKTGDSWYSEKKGEVSERIVSARAGTLLRYMCVVHPEMQGKIKVVG